MPRHLNLAVGAVAALALVVGGCSSDDDSSSVTSTTATTAPTVTGAVTVSAAASLTEAFTTIKDDFVDANPGTTVTINFGSSGQLATQITEGAPADVAAFADQAPMTTLDDAGLLAAPAQVFARNQLIIVTQPGNPKGITSLADLATVGTVSLCAETAPCGKFADQVLQQAGVTIPAEQHHAWPGRQGHPDRGDRGRCRGGHRLRDRRRRGGRQGRHRGDPGGRQRGGQLPHRRHHGHPEPGRRRRRSRTTSWARRARRCSRTPASSPRDGRTSDDRTVTGSRRRPPLPVLAAAGLAVAFFALPLVGLVRRASWATLADDLTSPDAWSALRLSLVCSLGADRAVGAVRHAAGLGPGPRPVPGPRPGPWPGAAAVGAAPGGRRRRPARRLQPPRHRRASTSTTGSASS